LLGYGPEPLPRTAGVFPRYHPHIAGQCLAVGEPVRSV
jgi:hypothetical protein